MTGVLGALSGGVTTAFLLARGRPEALARLVAPPADPPAVAARSFVALLLCLPCVLLPEIVNGAGLPSARVLVLDALGYVVGWVGFAVLSWELVGRTGRSALWWRFIAAWNWSNVAQQALLLAAGLLPLVGAPDWVSEVGWVFAGGWALWIEWYAIRLTLVVSGVTAAGFVAVDAMVGLMAMLLAGSVTT